MDIKHINKNYTLLLDMQVNTNGYVKTNRFNGTTGFIELTDGTTFDSIQIVYKKDEINDIEEIARLNTGDSIAVEGKLVATEGSRQQKFELKAEKVWLLKKSDLDFPLQKKKHSSEFLREIAHLRPRTNLFQAVMRIRSEMAFAIHSFFKSNNFIWVSTPIITSNDGEGAGEAFNVVTNDKEPFFDKVASLSVTGQLQAEAYAQAFKKVYTFGPTFRAEKSHTSRHAAEFWMIEPEVASCDLDTIIELAKTMLLSVIEHYLVNCASEIAYLEKWVDPTITQRLRDIKEKGFKKLEYKEVIKILEYAVDKKPEIFEDKNIYFGMDLGSEHERFICEKIIKGPVFVYNYPKDIKAFYMKLNDDNVTVKATDLLVPGIGELIGGSQREDDYDVLTKRCQELNMNLEPLQWYLDLRRFGYYKSSGFGLGFERLIMYLTGVDNIRDVIPFPRTHGSLKF